MKASTRATPCASKQPARSRAGEREQREQLRAPTSVHLAVSLLLCALAACETKSAPNPRGLLTPQGSGRPPVAPPTPVAAPTQPEFPSQSVFGSAAPPPPEPSVAKPAAAPDAGLEAAKRDLSAELARLIPAPVECLDLTQAAATSGGKLQVSVTAEVMPSGFISRAKASAAGQPASALHCIEARVVKGALLPDVPGAPRSVSASIPFEVVARPIRQEAPAPKPLFPGIQIEYAKPEKLEYAQPEKLEYAKPDGEEIARPSE